MRFLLCTISLLFSSSIIAWAQYNVDENIFRQIYNQKYDSAQILLQANETNIDPIYFAVLDIDCSYWKNVTGTDTPNYPEFEQTLQKYICENADSDIEKVIRLISLSYRLRFQIKRYQLIGAVSTRKQTMELFRELQAKANTLPPDQQELFQLYNALIVYFDNFLKPFWVNDKDKKMDRAVQNMEKLTRSKQLIVQTLSNYFLGKIYLKYEKEPEKAQTNFKWLSKTFPYNLKFVEYLEAGK